MAGARNGKILDIPPNEPPGSRVRHDFLSSLVVFMVALPLCIAIAQACGLPPEKGIITGAVGGLVVGLLAGSPLQVSGPAAGLIVLVLDLLQGEKGGVATLGVVVLLAGILQILAGALRLGRWFRAVSPAVIGGMLAGIGVVIVAKQFHVMLDDVLPKAADGKAPSVVQNLLTIPHAVWHMFDNADTRPQHFHAALIGATTIFILATWKSLAPKGLKLVPGPLVAVAVAVLMAGFFGDQLKRIQVAADLLASVNLPDWAALPAMLADADIWKMAVAFAVIASAETLLCATAVDKMHNGPRTQYNRELTAQGVGNILCGLAGSLPMTGVIVRSSANVEAGARTRLSSVLHGLWLVVFVMALPGLLQRIPTSCLAAILVYTGWKLMDFRGVADLWKVSKTEVAIYAVTVVVIVLEDLLVGVMTGVVLSVLKLVWTFSRLRVRREEHPQSRRVDLHLDGAATFLRLPDLAAELEATPPGTHLHVHLERLSYIDHACLDLLVGWDEQHRATGGKLTLDWGTLHARFRGPATPARPASPAEIPPEPTREVVEAAVESAAHPLAR